MSPESITSREFNSALDHIWWLGCNILVQMVSEEPVWEDFSSITYLVAKLVHGMEIPEELSEKGKDFVKRCFDRDPKQRWTADMLLEHPYLEKENETRNKRSGATYTFKRCSIK